MSGHGSERGAGNVTVWIPGVTTPSGQFISPQYLEPPLPTLYDTMWGLSQNATTVVYACGVFFIPVVGLFSL